MLFVDIFQIIKKLVDHVKPARWTGERSEQQYLEHGSFDEVEELKGRAKETGDYLSCADQCAFRVIDLMGSTLATEPKKGEEK